jgi:hypothetical protein
VKAGYAAKEVPIIIELNELRTILDLNMTVIKNTTIFPGSPVFANIQLTNLKDIQPMGVYMYYAITDFSGNILNYSTEQFDFNTRTATLQKSLTLPRSLNVGTYIFFTRAISNGSIVVGSDYFEVGEKKSFAAIIFDNLWILILIIILCIVIIMAVIEYRNRRRLRLLNLYMMINELKACINENNYEEAVKVFVRIKSYYNEPIAESLFENKEQLHDEIKKFADKLDTKLEKSKIALMQKQEEKPAGNQPSDNKKADSVTSATPAPAKNETREKAVKNKTKSNKKIRKARKHIKDGKKR